MINKENELLLTHDELLRILNYNKDSGIFKWKFLKINNQVNVGDEAGSYGNGGYITIQINKILYKAHRLAWFYVTGNWPKDRIDHKDSITNNNCFDNLREANASQNSYNYSKPITNTSGIKGVSYHKQTKKWRARINYDGKMHHLGLFDTIELAAIAYAEASKKYHKEFSNLG